MLLNTTKPTKFCTYILVFNEISHVSIIELNIKKIIRFFPQSEIYISDNKSTDGTWELLKRLPSVYPRVKIFQNSQNFGFSGNFDNLKMVENDSYILLLGASDHLSTFGLRELKFQIENNSNIDFFIFNWTYISQLGRTKIVKHGDIKTSTKGMTLDDFFKIHPYAPIGIMQYVAKKKILIKAINNKHMLSPQLGAFFDSFPCNFMTISKMSLAYVQYEEGWRSKVETIYLSHNLSIQDVLNCLLKAREEKRISLKIYRKIKRRYIRIPFSLIVNQIIGDKWGEQKESFQERLRLNTTYFFKSLFLYIKYKDFNFIFDLLIIISKVSLKPYKNNSIIKKLHYFYDKTQ